MWPKNCPFWTKNHKKELWYRKLMFTTLEEIFPFDPVLNPNASRRRAWNTCPTWDSSTATWPPATFWWTTTAMVTASKSQTSAWRNSPIPMDITMRKASVIFPLDGKKKEDGLTVGHYRNWISLLSIGQVLSGGHLHLQILIVFGCLELWRDALRNVFARRGAQFGADPDIAGGFPQSPSERRTVSYREIWVHQLVE